MERRNVTLSLPKSLLRKAKVVAAEEKKSLSELLKEVLEARVHSRPSYERAKKQHLRLLKQGFDLGTQGRLSVAREELHERR
jgi:metal-responsive CopG/Arc/MetJ family transcriptional regulator